MPTEAAFSTKLGDGRVRCGLCPRACAVGPGEVGQCRTRRNDDGRLIVLTHGRLHAVARDPIEKKPLFHYRPGSRTFSVASAGCNLVCPFCQNHSLSQALRCEAREPSGAYEWSGAQVVATATRWGSSSISFTYSEPVLSFEFAREVYAAASAVGLDLVFVTNGQIRPEPCRELAGMIQAANIDLKCFSDGKYRDVLGGDLGATLRTIETLRAAGVWVEVTTLVVPGFSDDETELEAAARFLAGVDRAMPWHLTRFHPDYRWIDQPATPEETLTRARSIGRAAGLTYVYPGNVPGHPGEKTLCPRCGAVVIDRVGYQTTVCNLVDGRCTVCGDVIAGKGLP